MDCKRDKIMSSVDFICECKEEVISYINKRLDRSTDSPEFSVYIVWYCKSLSNHKALLSTSLPDGMYYEFTYNGEKNEMYFDAYKKWENYCIKYENRED